MEFFSPFLAYNALGWFIGGLSMLVFALQIWRVDRTISTQLTRHYIRYALILGAGLLIFSLPGLLTANMKALKVAYIIGEGLIDISLVYQAWIAAHFILGSLLAKRITTIATGIAAAFLWAMQCVSPAPYRAASSVVWAMNTPAHIAITAILTILLLPVTWFFFKQSMGSVDLASRIKAFATGMTCLVIYVQYMFLLYYYHDQQPFWASIINIVAFSAFLLALLIPRKLTQSVMAAQLKS